MMYTQRSSKYFQSISESNLSIYNRRDHISGFEPLLVLGFLAKRLEFATLQSWQV